MKDLRSNAFPEMNPFWELLRQVMVFLGRGIEGLWFTYYDSEKEILISEKIGIIPEKQKIKFLSNSSSLVVKILNKSFKTAGYLTNGKGAVLFNGMAVGISGNLSNKVSEAIAILWIMAKRRYDDSGRVGIMGTRSFWEDLNISATILNIKDNNFIPAIALSLEEQYNFNLEREKDIETALNA